MNAEMINDRDLITMKLLYYFIKIKNYNPIIVQGAKNEIWLENLSEDIKKILSYSYKRQKVKTRIEFDTDIPPVLYGDKEKVEQMFLYTYEYLVEIIKQGKLEIKVDTIKVNNLCKLKFIFHSIDTNIPSEESVEDIKYLKVKKLAELINAKFKYSDNNILELSIIQKVKNPYKLLTHEIDNANIKYNLLDES